MAKVQNQLFFLREGPRSSDCLLVRASAPARLYFCRSLNKGTVDRWIGHAPLHPRFHSPATKKTALSPHETLDVVPVLSDCDSTYS